MPSRSQVHKVRKLVLTKATGVCAGEATSQMQLNWRRVKKEYFSVYLFRSAVTANAVSPVRRTTTVLKAMQIKCIMHVFASVSIKQSLVFAPK